MINSKAHEYYACLTFIHFPLKNLPLNMKALNVQSANIPYHTAIGPIENVCTSQIHNATRQHHMVHTDTNIENLTSPAALIPYAGTKESTHASGFAIVIAPTI